MATHDYVIANQTGANTRSDLNNAFSAIVSNNSSATAPATTYAFMWWADTANDLLKQRNAANSAWISILTLSTGVPLAGMSDIVDDTTPQLGGDLDLNGNDITGTGAIPSANLSGALPAIDGSALTGTVPSGIISMWSGLLGAIPSGWSLCDGTGGTPNLVGKFIKGASSAGGTGGSATTDGHTLTEAEMPSHTHGKSPYAPGSAAAYVAAGYNSYFNSTSNTTLATGGGGSHSHTFEPPYFELCYIIKD